MSGRPQPRGGQAELIPDFGAAKKAAGEVLSARQAPNRPGPGARSACRDGPRSTVPQTISTLRAFVGGGEVFGPHPNANGGSEDSTHVTERLSLNWSKP